MTHEAQMIVSNILIVAQRRLANAYAIGPFFIITDMLHLYFEEWDWL